MKSILMLTLMCILITGLVAEQIIVGTENYDTAAPTSSMYYYTVSAQLYQNSELGDLASGGLITEIAFQAYGNNFTTLAFPNLHISIGTVDHTSLSNSLDPNDTNIFLPENKFFYELGVMTVPNGEWVTITLPTPFLYNGIGNIVIRVVDLYGGGEGGPTTMWSGTSVDGFAGERCILGFALTPMDPDVLHTGAYWVRPNLRLTYISTSTGLDLSITGFTGPVAIPSNEDMVISVLNLGTIGIDATDYSVYIYENYSADGTNTPLNALPIPGTVDLTNQASTGAITILPDTYNTWNFSPVIGFRTLTAIVSLTGEDINLDNNSGTYRVYVGPFIDQQGLLYEYVNATMDALQVSKGETDATHIEIPATFTIPGTIVEIPVVKIANDGFADFTALIDLSMSDEIISIGDRAFMGCVGLSSIRLSNNLRTIGDEAFSSCVALGVISLLPAPTRIDLPSSLTSIGSQAFAYCTSITSLIIPSSVETMGDNPFVGCPDLDLEIEAGGNSPYSTQGHCLIFLEDNTLITGFADSDIPDFVEIIGDFAFVNTGVSAVDLPSGLVKIGRSAFSDNDLIIVIELPMGLQEIGDDAFSDCASLTTINIPNRHRDNHIYRNTAVGRRIFADCPVLTSVELPESITTIGVAMFSGCSSLENITFSGDVDIIGAEAFYNCSSLISIDIPAVASIGSSAFYGCGSLIEIELPMDLQDIGDDAFSDCASLTTISVPSRHRNGHIHRNATLGERIFAGCISLTSVDLPESITTIGVAMFSGCISLENIAFSGDVDIIGAEAFYNCSSLISIDIPAVVSIGSSAFYGCGSLIEIELPLELQDVGDDAFSDCASLTTISIPNRHRNGHIHRNATLGERIFAGCSALVSVELPESFTSIGVSMFADCTALENIVISDFIESIGGYAFARCSTLPEIQIPLSVVQIGSQAFVGCAVLTIYAVADDRPADWADDFNPDDRPVVWNYLSENNELVDIMQTKLMGNYPNPFNPSTTISFTLANPEQVSIEIYNVKGQKVCVLANDLFQAGKHNLIWNGSDKDGRIVSSGVYFYRMTAGRYTMSHKMLSIK